MNEQTISAANPKRLRRSLLFLAIGSLLFGFLILPAAIFLVGALVLGPYGGGAHGLGSFYADLLKNLVSGEPHTWFIALGPCAIVAALWLLFMRPDASFETPPRQNHPSRPKQRKEPTLSS